MPCIPLRLNQRFGGTYHLHLQGQRISQARKKHEEELTNCLALNYFYIKATERNVRQEHYDS
jgi:hypothetical protein